MKSSVTLCKDAKSIAVSDMKAMVTAPVGDNNTINIFNGMILETLPTEGLLTLV